MIQKHFDSLYELFADGVQQGITCIHIVADQKLNHLQIFVVNGHQEGGPTQRIHTIDVDEFSIMGFLKNPSTTDGKRQAKNVLNMLKRYLIIPYQEVQSS